MAIKQIKTLYKSQKSEFIAIYGRRRIGKSFLVSEVYERKLVFSVVGTYWKEDDKSYETYRRIQLNHFCDSLLLAGLSEQERKPDCWRETFLLLRKLLSGMKRRRKVILIDELPWLAGPQSSEMISELGYFWNSWADSQRNIVLVVCGSATSWMLDIFRRCRMRCAFLQLTGITAGAALHLMGAGRRWIWCWKVRRAARTSFVR